MHYLFFKSFHIFFSLIQTLLSLSLFLLQVFYYTTDISLSIQPDFCLWPSSMKFHPVDLNYEYPADNSSALFQQCGIVPAYYPFTRLTWIQPFSKPKILANSPSVPLVNVSLLHESLQRLEISRTKSFSPRRIFPHFIENVVHFRSRIPRDSPSIHHCSFEFPPPKEEESSRHAIARSTSSPCNRARQIRANPFPWLFFAIRVSIQMYTYIDSVYGRIRLNNDEF